MTAEQLTASQKQKYLQAIQRMEQAFLDYQKTVHSIKKEQNNIVKKALQQREQEQIKTILSSLK